MLADDAVLDDEVAAPEPVEVGPAARRYGTTEGRAEAFAGERLVRPRDQVCGAPVARVADFRAQADLHADHVVVLHLHLDTTVEGEESATDPDEAAHRRCVVPARAAAV